MQKLLDIQKKINDAEKERKRYLSDSKKQIKAMKREREKILDSMSLDEIKAPQKKPTTKKKNPEKQQAPKKTEPKKEAPPKDSFYVDEDAMEEKLGYPPTYFSYDGDKFVKISFENITKDKIILIKDPEGNNVSKYLHVHSITASPEGNKRLIVLEGD